MTSKRKTIATLATGFLVAGITFGIVTARASAPSDPHAVEFTNDPACRGRVAAGRYVAVPGDCIPTRDRGFGSSGIVTTEFPGYVDQVARDVVVTESRIVVGGYVVSADGSRDFALAAYTQQGVLDPTFGSGGLVVTDFAEAQHAEIAKLAVTPEGYVVAGGTAWQSGEPHMVVAVYFMTGNAGGAVMHASLDTSMQETGFRPPRPGVLRALAVNPTTGDIAIGGHEQDAGIWHPTVRHYNASGNEVPNSYELYVAFGAERGSVSDLVYHNGALHAVGGMRTRGKGGSFVAKFTADGHLDDTFGNGGIVSRRGDASGEGRMAVVGFPGVDLLAIVGPLSEHNYFGFTQFHVGTPHPWHNSDVMATAFPDVVAAEVRDAVVVGTGVETRVVSAGSVRTDHGTRFFITRHDTTGELDQTFGHGGRVIADFTSGDGGGIAGIAVDANHNIVAAGSVRRASANVFAVTRYPGDSTSANIPLTQAGAEATGTRVHRSPAGAFGLVEIDGEAPPWSAEDPIQFDPGTSPVVPPGVDQGLAVIAEHVENDTVIYPRTRAVLGVDIDTAEHQARVLYVVNWTILHTQAEHTGDTPFLEQARVTLTRMRQCGGNPVPDSGCRTKEVDDSDIRWSVNVTLRDAQRYLWGLSGPEQFAAKWHVPADVFRALDSVAANVYEFWKSRSIAVGSTWFEATDKPAGPVGGNPWFYLGVAHSADVASGTREQDALLLQAPNGAIYDALGRACGDPANPDYGTARCRR